jgi:hypothetical protein
MWLSATDRKNGFSRNRQAKQKNADMGTFPETVIVAYHLSFAGQGKQTFVFRFQSQQTNGLPFSLQK